MSILMDYLQEEAEKKKKSVKTWLEDVAKNADKCAWCTHVGKFTNPAVGNVVIDVLSKKPEHNGFLYTENTVCDKDISVQDNLSAFDLPIKVTLYGSITSEP